jgi:DNA invertase Pin-like site-specific DNA recombinase
MAAAALHSSRAALGWRATMRHHLSAGRPVRCAIYTRKSAANGIDDDLNSLEVQRDICAAYIKSQRARGWVETPERYDDGGFSGGNLNRPSLAKLLGAVEEGLVDVIVIYKLDRLTRSLSDFIRLIDLLDQYEVTFVSVTQSFDTQDSMGRLVLNILLTFAQFEREMLADRIRDKVHALRRAGRWVGGAAPYGYDLVKSRLVVNPAEAEIIRLMHQRYLELGCAHRVVVEMQERGVRSKQTVNRQGVQRGGNLANQSFVYGILANPTYVGEYHVDGEVIRALHDPIVDRETWERARALKEARRLKKMPNPATAHLLIRLLFDEFGREMVIWSGTKSRRSSVLRYYVSTPNHRLSRTGLKALRAEANDLEELVKAAICSFLRTRSQVSSALHMLGYRDGETEKLLDRADVAARSIDMLDRRRLRRVWEALVERIDVSRERVRIILRCEQVRAFLAWSGNGVFKPVPNTDARHHPIYVVETEAFAIRSERQFRLPLDMGYAKGKPKPGLVGLMSFARRAQALVYEERTLSFEEVARRLHCRQAFVMRALRLNYLAPDITAAIIDGRQPANLTRRKLLNASIPMDWAQQRVLLGFPARHDPRPGDQHY